MHLYIPQQFDSETNCVKYPADTITNIYLTDKITNNRKKSSAVVSKDDLFGIQVFLVYIVWFYTAAAVQLYVLVLRFYWLLRKHL